jgi:hypothetical protein
MSRHGHSSIFGAGVLPQATAINKFYHGLQVSVDPRYRPPIKQAYEEVMAKGLSYDEFYVKMMKIPGIEMSVINLGKVLQENSGAPSDRISSDYSIMNKQKLFKKLEDGNLSFHPDSIETIAQGFTAYMEDIVRELLGVFELAKNNDDLHRQKKSEKFDRPYSGHPHRRNYELVFFLVKNENRKPSVIHWKSSTT